MSARAIAVRKTVRGSLAAGILIFAWYAASRVASGSADGTLLATVSALLLIVLLVGVARMRVR